MVQNGNVAFELIDKSHRPVGQVIVERREDDLCLGRFIAGPGFAAVESLFRDFEEAANAQALSVVDTLDAAIAALGLSLRSSDGERSEIHDVQIWSDGGITFRVREHSLETLNGSPATARPAEPAPKS